jgi:ATP-dependent Clp protease ATP-binding subunit ClpA
VIATEHLLLGVLRESAELREYLKVDRTELESRLRSEAVAARTATTTDIPLDDLSKGALAHAAEEAERLKHRHIGSEHLLLGIMREERGRGARVLRELGAAPVDEVRKEIIEAGPKEANEPTPTKVVPWVPSLRFVDEESGLELSAGSRGQAIPRIGEAVVVERGGAAKVYRVTDVRWMFLQPMQSRDLALTTVEVRVRREAAAEK